MVQPRYLSPAGRGRIALARSGSGGSALRVVAPSPGMGARRPFRPLPCGGLCVLGRLALVCRKALFLRREWPRIEPRTVFSCLITCGQTPPYTVAATVIARRKL